MKKKWIKRVIVVLLIPIFLLLLIAISLYIPPVQNFIQKKASSYASEATDLDISIGRVNLYFPLNLVVKDVQVLDKGDTILSLDRLHVRVQSLPLLKGQVEIDKFSLRQATINTKDLIDGIGIQGKLGQLQLISRGINLNENSARINQIELVDTDLKVQMKESNEEAPKDSVSTPLDWNLLIDKISLKNVKFKLDIPKENLQLATIIPETTIEKTTVDLSNETYRVDNLSLKDLMLTYKLGEVTPSKGFNPSDIKVQNLTASIDSIVYSSQEIEAKIKEFYLLEKSGLEVTTLQASLAMNDSTVLLHNLLLKTPYSYLRANIDAPLDIQSDSAKANIDISLSLSLKEVANILGVEIEKGNFETWGPILGNVQLSGTKKRLDIDNVNLELTDAFNFTVVGSLFNIDDEKKRQGQIDLLGDFYDITRFNSWLDESIQIPQNIVLRGMVALNSDDGYAALNLAQKKGGLDLEARYNLKSEKYSIRTNIDSLSVDRILRDIPIRNVVGKIDVEGQYIDLQSTKAKSSLKLRLENLTYDTWSLRDFDLLADLKQEILSMRINSNNQVMKGNIDATYAINNPIYTFDAAINIDALDLFRVKLIDFPVKQVVNLNGDIKAGSNGLFANIETGDFKLGLASESSINTIISNSDKLGSELVRQLDKSNLDFKKLQHLLPAIDFKLNIGDSNIVMAMLKEQNLSFKSSLTNISINPYNGITGLSNTLKVKLDTLTLDTISFRILQDTTKLEMKVGVINKYHGSLSSFSSYATLALKEKSGNLLLEFMEANNNLGLQFGVDVKPQSDGFLFTLVPENPIIAFKKFKFRDNKNTIFLRKDLRVFADVDMFEDRSVGFRIQSNAKDSVSLQNMNVELRRLDLQDMVQLFPFLPDFEGYLSAESYFVQTENSLRLSMDVFLEGLKYEKKSVGDFRLGATWLPVNSEEDLVNIYLSHNDKDVLYADGNIQSLNGDKVIDVNANLSHFPLSIANVIFPNEEIKLDGDIDGEIHITGSANNPKINGQIKLDSVSIYAKQADAYFRFDNRPVMIVDSKVVFKDFSIYTTSNNPFQINGTIDISDMSSPVIDLKLKAKNYPLLNAKRKKESLVYGKMFVDVDATVKGLIDALKMRGAMSILDNTDVTYVLTESPLTVQDRLGDLVTFTSFNDTIRAAEKDSLVKSLGGIDMVMAVHIAPSVSFKVDLSPDRSSRVELKGGGDLSLQYNPQTDFSLIGRYTLSDGLIKYSLPIIPSKEFKITTDSYVEWTGKIDDPKLNIIAKDRVRATVSEQDGSSQMVNFNVIIGAKNKLENLELIFDLEAPENATVQNQLAAMSKEERNKQAIALLATGVYLAGGAEGKGGLDMGSALNSVLQSQINALAGATLKNASISVGVEEYDMSETGKKRTDYSFSYAQRFFNDRIQVVVGGRVKTGEEVSNDLESIIDNVSIEYRLDASGTRYVRVFRDRNFESILDGEVIETGVGLVLRKKINRLGELFIFKRKKKNDVRDTK